MLIDTAGSKPIEATTGSLFFNPVQTLKKIGDAHLDMWTGAKVADSIPRETNCERVYGSRLTKPGGESPSHGGNKNLNETGAT
ncbi:hypothetical protein GQ53DRAFT_835989 [Thozetella sp. PMI_491]|nr:hypothetical protein GQ53DRAFT_835989 [Thozetella sp. PMI_491]